MSRSHLRLVLAVVTVGLMFSTMPLAYAVLLFGPAVRISTNTPHSLVPSVAANGNYVYVAWEDWTPVTGSGTQPEIWMRASSNNGVSFSSPVRISTNTYPSEYPSVAAVGSYVYVAWQDDTPVSGSGACPDPPYCPDEIWMRVSANNGASFGSSIRISTNTGSSTFPSVAAAGNYVYVAWRDDTPVTGSGTQPEIWMRVSSNYGGSFGSAIRMSTNAGASTLPSIAASGSYVYVAWQDNTGVSGSSGSYEIWVRASSNYGGSFGSPIRISTNTGDSAYPSVAASGSYVYVAWHDNTPVTGSGGSYEIWMRASSNYGASFGSPIRISTNTGISRSPSVATSGSNVYVAWKDDTAVSQSGTGYEVWLRVSINNGGRFAPPMRISTNTGASEEPSVAVSGNTGLSGYAPLAVGSYVYVAWEDNTSVTGSGSGFEVWLRAGS